MVPAGEVKRRIGIVGKVRCCESLASTASAACCCQSLLWRSGLCAPHSSSAAACSSTHPATRAILAAQGVTFDCGGLNVKAGAGSMIEMMKFDMGGSGAALGAARALAALQPPGVEVPQPPWSTVALDAY
jgi:Cytosol aminopeptidase family, catalytic domain